MHGLATDPAVRFDSAEAFGAALAAASYLRWGPTWLVSQPVPVLSASTMTVPPPPGQRAATTMQAGPIVRPVESDHQPVVELADVRESDLVPVQAVAPQRPLVPTVLAVVFALATLVLAAIRLGAPAQGGSLINREITVAGQSTAPGHRVTIDLTKPVPVHISRTHAATHVRLSLMIGGIALRTVQAPLRPDGNSMLPAPHPPYLYGGHATGRLELLRGDTVTGTWRFAATTKQSSYLTAVAGADLLVLLFGIGYVESHLRAMRRARRRVSGSVGVPVVAAILGAAATGLAWVALGREPTAVSVGICAIGGACAGIAATVGALRTGAPRSPRRAGAQLPA